MAEETIVPDGTTVIADATTDTATKHSNADIDKIIAERDKAKEKLRKIEEADKKRSEEKMVEEGKLKELLAQRDSELATLKTKADAFEAQQLKMRESLLAKLSDTDKKIAEKLNDIDDLSAFVSRLTESKEQPYNLQQKVTPNEPEFYTKAEISAMTPEQIRANLEKVNKSLAHFK